MATSLSLETIGVEDMAIARQVYAPARDVKPPFTDCAVTTPATGGPFESEKGAAAKAIRRGARPRRPRGRALTRSINAAPAVSTGVIEWRAHAKRSALPRSSAATLKGGAGWQRMTPR